MDINKPISSTVKEIADSLSTRDVIIKSEVIGITGRSVFWDYYQTLSEEAEDYELLKLVEYPSPTVRCYAFFVLVDRKYKDIFPVLKNLITDTELIETIDGCELSEEFVSDIVYEHWWRNKFELSTNDQSTFNRILDSMTIYKNNFLSDRAYSVRNLIVKDKYYPSIRKGYKDSHEPRLLLYISKFKKEQDVDLILKWLTKLESYNSYSLGLECIVNYPHPKFFSYLKELHNGIMLHNDYEYIAIRKIYQAIVVYKNSESEAMIREAVNKANKDKQYPLLACLWLALEKYPDKIYEDIQKKIEISDKMKDKALKIDNNDTDYLWDIDE